MFKFIIYTFGKELSQYEKTENEYIKRLSQSASIKIEQLSIKQKTSDSHELTKKNEGSVVLAKIKDSDFLVALDENGKLFNSYKFSEQIEDWGNRGFSTIHFVIGGAYGISDELKKRANLLLSLSTLTFPYALARLILIEQIYRGMNLRAGTSYHK